MVIPQADETLEAGKLLEKLGKLWQEATLKEKNKILSTMLEAVYVDLLATRSVVGIQPKAPFYALFERMKTGSKVTIFDPKNDKKETGSSLHRNPDLGLVETGER